MESITTCEIQSDSVGWGDIDTDPLGWSRSLQCRELPEVREGLTRQVYKGHMDT